MKQSLLSSKYRAKIIEAIGKEIDVAMLYKQMGNQLENIGYFGSASFFKNEGDEEMKHYQVWADFMNDMGDVADIPAVKPKTDKIIGLRQAFTVYLNREKELMDFYNAWYTDCDDASIMQQLLFFVEVQRKSVGEAGDFLATLDRCGSNEAALLIFDKEING